MPSVGVGASPAHRPRALGTLGIVSAKPKEAKEAQQAPGVRESHRVRGLFQKMFRLKWN